MSDTYAEIANCVRVERRDRGWHVTGSPWWCPRERPWSPPLVSKRAAELVQREVISDLAMGLDPEAECRKDGIFEHCERLASLVTYLEDMCVPDPWELAKRLARDEPWRGWPRPSEDDLAEMF